ncbi:dephospho-CoA kinase [Sutterella sp.]|uniref:dephospho-CoA kinase n=1 Tax=Sutterella sp. TaxID=1981025 RepID=UPI0026DFE3C2|nr:dephospho-CoA kinase [Sutterella sp.]MDO5530820.1 dephospho-CoA kinase [Sutterella sp.]
MGWVLGLTGGAGSGKSTAAAVLSQMGFPIVDADAVSRSLTAAGGGAMPAIVERFGAEMAAPDGALDRARMRELVFRDPAARRDLEAIIHSRLEKIVAEQFAEAFRTFPIAVYDCPLLIESPAARARAQRILVIDTPEEIQIARLGTRSGLSPDAARRLLAAQVSRRDRLLAADDIIVNDCGRAEFEARVHRYGETLLNSL